MPSPTTFFIYSLEPWGDMWYSKHHYAAHLAKTHTVFFVSLPDRWRWTDLFSFKVKVHTVPEGLNVVEYRNNLPLRFLPNWLSDRVARMNALKLKKLVPEGEVVHWCFHPTRVLDHRTLRRPNTKVIYHVVDPYQGLRNDRSFARSSDLVVAINPWYLENYGKLNPNCVLIPHGVRAQDRLQDGPAAIAHQNTWGDYAVLATGLSQYVNYPLLVKVAQRYPELKLIIAGQLFPLDPVQESTREALFALPNVHYIGVLHPNDLKSLVHGAKLGLLTYDIEPTLEVPLTAGRTPLKVLTYLSQLCPMVSTNNSYVPVLENKGHFKAENEAHFVQLVGEVLSGRYTVDAAMVNQYLDSVEYGKLIATVLERLVQVDTVPSTSAIGFSTGSSEEENTSQDQRPLIPMDSPVLIISNEEWDGPRYSKHRYALALRSLRKVYFIDPPDQWRPSHLFRPGIRQHQTPEGIVVLSYKNAIPLFGGRLGPLNERIIFRRLRRFLHKEGEKAPLFWTFDPSRLSDPKHLGCTMTVYHCADDHAFRWRGERLLAERCDHVFCIARDLMPRFEDLNTSVHHVPHGLADSDMAPIKAKKSLLSVPPGYGLYIGNINDRHDFALWEKLIRANPNVTWLVVGPVNVTDPLGLRLVHGNELPNLIFKPTVSYSSLRDLIADASFGFLFMRRDHPANRISSQKVVQFLAQGKPFFCSWFSEYENRTDLVQMSDDHETALADFARWRREGELAGASERRLEFARNQRFSNLLEKLPFRF